MLDMRWEQLQALYYLAHKKLVTMSNKVMNTLFITLIGFIAGHLPPTMRVRGIGKISFCEQIIGSIVELRECINILFITSIK